MNLPPQELPEWIATKVRAIRQRLDELSRPAADGTWPRGSIIRQDYRNDVATLLGIIEALGGPQASWGWGNPPKPQQKEGREG